MKQLGLIGKVLEHSFSARYFNYKFEREGLSTEYAYALYELPEISHLSNLLKTTPNLIGFNVTIPYKQQIIPYLDELSSETRAIGAVNCVKIESDGRLVGYNTDVEGIRISLCKLLGDVEPDAALIFGSGGASQAVQYALAERNIPYQIVSRDATKGNITYNDLTAEVFATHHLIINTSPVGMYPNIDDAPQMDYSLLTPDHYLFDLVYNPAVTRFLAQGADQGAHTLSGLDMLYAQAEAAWKIWLNE